MLTQFCKQVRAPIRSVTHLWADFVAHTCTNVLVLTKLDLEYMKCMLNEGTSSARRGEGPAVDLCCTSLYGLNYTVRR
jgi:hypothetical protein